MIPRCECECAYEWRQTIPGSYIGKCVNCDGITFNVEG